MIPAYNFENALQNINSFITIKPYDRCSYAEDFNTITNFIIKGLCYIDPIFGQLHNGTYIVGSYADKVKVSAPNEYDLNIHLKLRNFRNAIITIDKNMPGYVQINIADILRKIRTETHNKSIYELLLKLVDANGFLAQDKIFRWFESLMTKLFRQYDCHNKLITIDNKEYTLFYRKSGPAHTVNVDQNGRQIDIDFVPAFIFDKSQWNAERSYHGLGIKNTEIMWTAIPKPAKGRCGNISFRTSYVELERFLINNRQNLKNTFKMIKKLRDRQKIVNLKSYYIKTVYLWENELNPDLFWIQSADFILMYMLERILYHVQRGNLPFFWDTRENILAVLTKNQLTAIEQMLKNVLSILKKYKNVRPVPEIIYSVFLTDKELNAMNKNETIIDTIENEDKVEPWRCTIS